MTQGEMTEGDSFFPYVMPFAPMLSEPAAIQFIRVAAQTFCERTRTWRAEDKFAVTTGTVDYVCVPPEAALYEIEGVWYTQAQDDTPNSGSYDGGSADTGANLGGCNGVVITPGNADCLCAGDSVTEIRLTACAFVDMPIINLADGGGAPRFYSQMGWNSLRLDQVADGTLRTSFYLKPSQTAQVFPIFLLDQFAQTIADGVLSRALMLPGESKDVRGAAIYAASFEAALCRYSSKGSAGQQRAPRRVRSDWF